LIDAIRAALRKWLKVGFRKVQRVPNILVPKYIITSEWLHFKNCWKKWPKGPYPKGPMADS